MRTRDEILNRFNTVNDFFGTQQGDLLSFLPYEDAKPHLNDDYVAKVEAGQEVWTPLTDPKKEILEYLGFAYQKAEDQRGLSAIRSMLHFKAWIWLDDEDFYNEIMLDMENGYDDYGKGILDKIAAHYGYKRSEG